MHAQNLHDAAFMITAHSRAVPPAAAALRRFNFSKWAVSLNSTPPGMERLLPPSDVRWRRDVHLLEQGQYEQVFFLEETPCVLCRCCMTTLCKREDAR